MTEKVHYWYGAKGEACARGLSGRLLVVGDGEPQEAAPGSMFVAPRGHRHGFSSPSDEQARVLGLWAPPEPALAFMRDIGAALTPDTLGDLGGRRRALLACVLLTAAAYETDPRRSSAAAGSPASGPVRSGSCTMIASWWIAAQTRPSSSGTSVPVSDSPTRNSVGRLPLR